MRYIRQNIFRKALACGLVTLLSIGAVILGHAEEKTITLAAMNWEPIYGETLKEGGVFTAITRAAFGRVGYQVKIDWMPWNRALRMAKNGTYEGVMGGVMNSERARYFSGTDMIMPFERLLFSRADVTINYVDLEDLKPYVIGVHRGSALVPTLQAADLNLEEVSEYEYNIKKMMAGRIDLMIADKFTMARLLGIYPEYQGKIKTVSLPLKKWSLHLLFSKLKSDHAVITSDFNRGFREIIEDGTFETIVTNYGFSVSDFR